MAVRIRTLTDYILSKGCSRKGRQYTFICLISACLVSFVLVLRGFPFEINWLCADWLHIRLKHAIAPIDYTPRGNVTNLRNLYREYLSLVETPTFKCEKLVRYGNSYDGGWDLCDEEPYAIRPPCLVHSWGINWDFSFDDSISTKGGCSVFAFDPSMETESFDRSVNLHFYNFGIKGTSFNEETIWDLRTYEETLRYLGQQRKTIDFLKMDVEGAEWAPLGSPTMSADILPQVRQMALEVHVFHDTSEAELAKNVQTLKLLRHIGFEIYSTERNPCGLRLEYKNHILGYAETCCHNVYFVNTKYKKPS